MNVPAPLRPVRRLWPQKVRTRLTLLYAALFFAAGSALLGLTYGLVASSLPVQTAATVSNPKLNNLNKECKPPKGVTIPESLLRVCKEAEAAYTAGSASGSQAQRQRALSDLLAFSLAGLAVMTVASGGLGWFMSGRVLRPVRVITETARRASEQHLGERLALTGARDELKELADTFDGMLERLDSAFATQRRFVANASHELRTPLTVMRTAIDVTLAKPVPDGAAAHRHGRARAALDRPSRDHGRGAAHPGRQHQGKLSAEFTDLATYAEDAIDAAAPEIECLDLRVDTKLDPAETTGDPQLLERMIWNLVGNAVRHNEPGGWIRLRTGSSDGTVYLEIANSGPFIPVDAVPSLFEPFRRMEPRTGVREGVRARPVHRPLRGHRAPRDRHRPQLARRRARHLSRDPPPPGCGTASSSRPAALTDRWAEGGACRRDGPAARLVLPPAG